MTVNKNHNIVLQFIGKGLNFTFPDVVEVGEVKENLYLNDCFELFLGSGSEYLEWNISPTGHWNGYAFANYRQNKPVDVNLFKPLDYSVKFQHPTFTTNLTLPWRPVRELLSGKDPYKIQISVVEMNDKQMNYWALDHKRANPD